MKKMLSVLLASAMAISAVGSLAACGGGGSDNANKITVWAPQASHDAYKSLIAGFKEAYPDYASYEIEFVAKGEGDVQSSMGTDPGSGAEVFFFASDHYGNMRANNYLQPLTSTYETNVKGRDIKGCYEFVTDGNDNKIYAFPATNDNGYFLWYDSEFYTEEDVKSLDTMQSKAKENNKHIMYNYSDAWYSPSFFIGMGCEFGYTDTEMKHYKADLDTPQAKAATEALLNYFSAEKNNKYGKTSVITSGDLAAGFANGDYVAGISGTWEYDNIKKQMVAKNKDPETIKATKLPTFKATVEGDTEKEYNMGTFYGGKYCGVNRSKPEAKIAASLALADWLTNEKGQEARFDAQAAGPSNIKVAAMDKVKSNIGLSAYNLQVTTGNNLVQGAQSDTFWGDSGIKSIVSKIVTQDETANSKEKVLGLLKDLSDSLNT